MGRRRKGPEGKGPARAKAQRRDLQGMPGNGPSAGSREDSFFRYEKVLVEDCWKICLWG